MWQNGILYYPGGIDASKQAQKMRQTFYKELDWIKRESISSEFRWEQFYHYVTYTMRNGNKYEYMEDNDYMIPYWIKRIEKETN